MSGKTWSRANLEALHPDRRGLNLDEPDMTGAVALLAGVHTAERHGSAITGTLNGLNMVAIQALWGRIKPVVPPDTPEADPFRSVPYEVTLDRDGNLRRLQFDMPRYGIDAPAGQWSIEFTGYGDAKPVEGPPDSEILAR
jgi:hypothetical protein